MVTPHVVVVERGSCAPAEPFGPPAPRERRPTGAEQLQKMLPGFWAGATDNQKAAQMVLGDLEQRQTVPYE